MRARDTKVELEYAAYRWLVLNAQGESSFIRSSTRGSAVSTELRRAERIRRWRRLAGAMVSLHASAGQAGPLAQVRVDAGTQVVDPASAAKSVPAQPRERSPRRATVGATSSVRSGLAVLPFIGPPTHGCSQRSSCSATSK